MLALDLGCGNRPKRGYIGVDILPGTSVALVLDLRTQPLPFPDNSIDAIYTDHFLEHLSIEAIIKVMAEIHRVCKTGAEVEIRVPHFSGFTNFYEYHKTSFRYNSFAEFTGERGMYQSAYRFKLVSKKLHLVNRQSPLNHPTTKWFIWNYPMEWLVNKFPRLYETSAWRNVFPAWEIRFIMEVIK